MRISAPTTVRIRPVVCGLVIACTLDMESRKRTRPTAAEKDSTAPVRMKISEMISVNSWMFMSGTIPLSESGDRDGAHEAHHRHHHHGVADGGVQGPADVGGQ